MSIHFVSASSQCLQNTAPIAFSFPMTIGLWCRAATVGVNKTIWSWGDTAAANDYIEIAENTGFSFAMNAVASGTGTSTNIIAATSTNNLNTFLCVRFIAANNRRGEGLSGQRGVIKGGNTLAGTTGSVQSTTSRSPSGLDTMTIGARGINTIAQYFDGDVAEFWYTDTDIYPAGAMDIPFLWTLAYHGPFSIPSVASSVIEYRSFRDKTDTPGPDTYFGKYGAQSWANSNAPILGTHFPLPAGYATPRSFVRDFHIRKFESAFGAVSASRKRRRLMIL